jgi:hypothetical protein
VAAGRVRVEAGDENDGGAAVVGWAAPTTLIGCNMNWAVI